MATLVFLCRLKPDCRLKPEAATGATSTTIGQRLTVVEKKVKTLRLKAVTAFQGGRQDQDLEEVEQHFEAHPKEESDGAGAKNGKRQPRANRARRGAIVEQRDVAEFEANTISP